MIPLLVALVGAYLLGSLPVAFLAARAWGVDIFQVGTGNPGASNVFRNVDRQLGVFVFAADTLKAAMAILLARIVGVPVELLALVGAAAVLGHWAPVFLRFRGGAGLACAIGAALGISPVAGSVGLAVGVLFLWFVRSAGHAAGFGLVALVIASVFVDANWVTPVGIAGVAGLVLGRDRVLKLLSR